MAKKKRKRIEAVKSFANVTHHGEHYKFKWHEIFGNSDPITLELGCGRGDLILALAKQHPQRNFIGVDLKGARLWAGASIAIAHHIDNLFFIRGHILQLPAMFKADSINEFWITFPDPYPKKPRKRMTHERYLAAYQQIAVTGASFYLKTDDGAFYQFSLESLNSFGCILHKAVENLYANEEPSQISEPVTTYEKRHINEGKSIKFIHFALPKINKGEDHEQ